MALKKKHPRRPPSRRWRTEESKNSNPVLPCPRRSVRSDRQGYPGGRAEAQGDRN